MFSQKIHSPSIVQLENADENGETADEDIVAERSRVIKYFSGLEPNNDCAVAAKVIMQTDMPIFLGHTNEVIISCFSLEFTETLQTEEERVSPSFEWRKSSCGKRRSFWVVRP